MNEIKPAPPVVLTDDEREGMRRVIWDAINEGTFDDIVAWFAANGITLTRMKGDGDGTNG